VRQLLTTKVVGYKRFRYVLSKYIKPHFHNLVFTEKELIKPSQKFVIVAQCHIPK